MSHSACTVSQEPLLPEILLSSDEHFFSPAHKERLYYDFVSNVLPKRWLKVGDIFDLWSLTGSNFKKTSEMQLRSWDRTFYMLDQGVEIIIVDGNHEGFSKQQREWVNKQLEWINEKYRGSLSFVDRLDIENEQIGKVLIAHGHQYDPPIAEWVYKLGSSAYEISSWYDTWRGEEHGPVEIQDHFSPASWGKGQVKKYFIDKLKFLAAATAAMEGKDVTISGHTHMPDDCIITVSFEEFQRVFHGKEKRMRQAINRFTGESIYDWLARDKKRVWAEVRYLNDGSWTDKNPSYMTFETADAYPETAHWRDTRHSLGLGRLPEESDHNPYKKKYRSQTKRLIGFFKDNWKPKDYDKVEFARKKLRQQFVQTALEIQHMRDSGKKGVKTRDEIAKHKKALKKIKSQWKSLRIG